VICDVLGRCEGCGELRRRVDVLELSEAAFWLIACPCGERWELVVADADVAPDEDERDEDAGEAA